MTSTVTWASSTRSTSWTGLRTTTETTGEVRWSTALRKWTRRSVWAGSARSTRNTQSTRGLMPTDSRGNEAMSIANPEAGDGGARSGRGWVAWSGAGESARQRGSVQMFKAATGASVAARGVLAEHPFNDTRRYGRRAATVALRVHAMCRAASTMRSSLRGELTGGGWRGWVGVGGRRLGRCWGALGGFRPSEQGFAGAWERFSHPAPSPTAPAPVRNSGAAISNPHCWCNAKLG